MDEKEAIMTNEERRLAKEAATSLEEVERVIFYSPCTGKFFWNPRYGRGHRNMLAGKEAGCIAPIGYRALTINQKYFWAHRVAWFLFHMKWPEGEIDHINGDKLDNRIKNLRIVTSSQNKMNAKIRYDNKSGAKGIIWDGTRNKWMAYIRADGKQKHLGRFDNIEDAKLARAEATKSLHGDYARSNFNE